MNATVFTNGEDKDRHRHCRLVILQLAIYDQHCFILLADHYGFDSGFIVIGIQLQLWEVIHMGIRFTVAQEQVLLFYVDWLGIQAAVPGVIHRKILRQLLQSRDQLGDRLWFLELWHSFNPPWPSIYLGGQSLSMLFIAVGLVSMLLVLCAWKPAL
jgi:hypothetical protein